MPHRAFRMAYAVDVGDDRPLVGIFANLADARHWCETYDYPCEVRPVMPAVFACEQTLDEEADRDA